MGRRHSSPVRSTNANWVLVGATAVMQDGTTYNNFVMSHGSCGPIVVSQPPQPLRTGSAAFVVAEACS